MRVFDELYINGEWVAPSTGQYETVVNPANGESLGKIGMGDASDVDFAVAAAKEAFKGYSNWSVAERLELLESILAHYEKHSDEMAEYITREMGSPITLSKTAQVPCGTRLIKAHIDVLKNYKFEETIGDSRVVKEPIGVCGLITPWNWPMNQVAIKVIPALAAGCTMVLKPANLSPLSAVLFADILHEAGVPKGVFNMLNGRGRKIGERLCLHPDIDLISFTGSTETGGNITAAAAKSIKKVCLELGGKSPYVVLEDADFSAMMPDVLARSFSNGGQTCTAPTRLIVPESRKEEFIEAALAQVANIRVGDPADTETTMGPMASESQFKSVQRYIQAGIEEGARLLCGGPGKPEGLEAGAYVKPTLFADVDNQMTIAQEEIFGPVISIISYESLDQAIEIANDSIYGLAAYVWSEDKEKAEYVARKLRAGMVTINGAAMDWRTPFGGYKQSGVGRERGEMGLEEYLEAKAIAG